MKKLAFIQFMILAMVSFAAALLTFFAGGLAKHLWHSATDGAVALAKPTLIAINHGYILALACGLASLVCVAISIKRPDDVGFLWRLFTLIVSIEIIGQTMIILFCLLPAMNIHPLM